MTITSGFRMVIAAKLETVGKYFYKLLYHIVLDSSGKAVYCSPLVELTVSNSRFVISQYNELD